MKNIGKVCGLLIVSLLTSCASIVVSNIALKDAGIVGGNAISTRINRDTPTEEITGIDNVRFIESTERIPAVKGTAFGIQYFLNGQPKDRRVNVTHSATFPPITNPKTGITLSQFSYKYQAKISQIDPNFFGYIFQDDWEVAPGEWILRVEYGDELILEKKFVVYEP